MVTSSVCVHRPKGNPSTVSPFQILAFNSIKKLGGTCYFKVTGEYDEDSEQCESVEDANEMAKRYDERGYYSSIDMVIP